MGTQPLVRDARWPFQEIEGEAVVVVPERREVHRLDPVGTFIWNLLKSPRRPAEVRDAVAGEFDVDPSRAEADVDAFLSLLLERGLAVRA